MEKLEKKLKTRKKFILFLFFCAFITTILFSVGESSASEKKEGIENFPESYRPYLQELKKKYPNWNFTALYTGFDWNYVIRTGKYFWEKFSSKIIFR